jgi:secreted trypsin-like serine protease
MFHHVSIYTRFLAARRASARRLRLGVCALAAALSGCSSSNEATELGRAEQPILRGQVDREHPQVMVLADRAGFLCTGTLIDVRGRVGFLLTAAHCVTEEDAGATRIPPERFLVISGDDFETSTTAFPVEAIQVNPGYDGTFAVDDVAVVRLDLGDVEPPPPIPALAASEDKLHVSDSLLLVGFGQTERSTENSVRRHVSRAISGLDDDIVTYSQQDGKGTCFGDSGGPALVTVNGTERVAAITSGGVGSAEDCSGGIGVSMRVSAFSGFIESALDALGPGSD